MPLASDHRYTVISSDCHGGANIADYRPVSRVGVPRRVRRLDGRLREPVRRRQGRRRRPQLGLGPTPVRDAGRRDRGRGDLPQHDPSVLPQGVPGQPAPRRRRRRPRQAHGGHPGPQPLAGRLLRRRPGPASRHRPDHAARRRRRGGRDRMGGRGRPDRRRAPARSASRVRRPSAVRPRLRTDLGHLRRAGTAHHPPFGQRGSRHGSVPRGQRHLPARGHLVGPPHPVAPDHGGRDGTPPHAAVRLHRAGLGLGARGADPAGLLPRPHEQGDGLAGGGLRR